MEHRTHPDLLDQGALLHSVVIRILQWLSTGISIEHALRGTPQLLAPNVDQRLRAEEDVGTAGRVHVEASRGERA